MGESQNVSSKYDQEIQRHEAKARQLEQEAQNLTQSGYDEQTNQRVRTLQEQARQEWQEAANLRQLASAEGANKPNW